MQKLNSVTAPAVEYRFAAIAAVAICSLLTIASLVFPPAMFTDPGLGFLAWRSFLQGGPFNTLLIPEPTNIANDQAIFLTWWSPGQYLAPGILSLIGISLGLALSLTVGISLLICLLGWIQFARHFSLGPVVALLAVIFVSTFRYSTLPFGIYNGGEILLQAAAPWIFLLAWRVPALNVYQAGGTAALIVLIGFFVKLTGLIVVVSALVASGLLALVRCRRITSGLVGGTIGAGLAMGLLYLMWFSHGATPAAAGTRPFQPSDIILALSAPWAAGFSWTDLLAWLFFHPSRPLLHDASALVWFLPVLAIPVAVLILAASNHQASGPGLKAFVVCVCALYAVVMLALYIRGASVGSPERHFRSAGTLVLVCALAVILRSRMRSTARYLFLLFCCFMSLYGIGSYAQRALSVANSNHLDSFSRTSQPLVDRAALEFIRGAYLREGRDALFVLPSAEMVVALPLGARILPTLLNFESEQDTAARQYSGVIPGRLYVVMPSSIASANKGRMFLMAFRNYAFSSWKSKTFGLTTVFIQ